MGRAVPAGRSIKPVRPTPPSSICRATACRTRPNLRSRPLPTSVSNSVAPATSISPPTSICRTGVAFTEFNNRDARQQAIRAGQSASITTTGRPTNAGRSRCGTESDRQICARQYDHLRAALQFCVGGIAAAPDLWRDAQGRFLIGYCGMEAAFRIGRYRVFRLEWQGGFSPPGTLRGI